MERARELAADFPNLALGCEGGLDAVLSTVGVAYLARLAPDAVRLCRASGADLRLGEAFLACGTIPALAERVWRGIVRALGDCPRGHGRGGCSSCESGECLQRIILIAASDDPDAAEILHRYIRACLDHGSEVRNMGARPELARARACARSVSSECERTRQFVRFSHMADGSYQAVFRPKADTVPLVAAHFARRMAQDRFMLVDPVHRSVALHDPSRGTGAALQLAKVDEALAGQLSILGELSPDERYVRSMWRLFYERLSLPDRDASMRGYDLRAQLMPKRLWADLTELAPDDGTAGPAPARYAGGAKGLPE